MTLARLMLRNLQQQRPNSSLLVSGRESISLFAKRDDKELTSRRFMSAEASESSDVKTSTETNKQVCVGEGTDKKKLGKRLGGRLFNRRRRRDLDFAPPLWEFFPSGIGNALMQATENINKVFNSMGISSPHLPPPAAHVKTEDKFYRLYYEIPGLSKDNVKITVDEDGVLRVSGERKQEKNKEEEEKEDGKGDWSARIYYNTRITLPDDAKFDEIKAELKEGLLTITMPRIENSKKDVKQVLVC